MPKNSIKLTTLKKVNDDRIGRIKTNGVVLERHEYALALLLTEYGIDIEFIRPTNTPKNHNADFFINGRVWEAKSPIGTGKKTIERKIHEAGRQARNMIFDARRLKGIKYDVLEEVKKRFIFSKTIREMILLISDNRVIVLKK